MPSSSSSQWSSSYKINKKQNNQNNQCKVFIGNLPNCSSQDIIHLFKNYDVVEIKIKRKANGIYSFVQFNSNAIAQEVIDQFNGKSFKNKEIRIEFGKGYQDYSYQTKDYYIKDKRLKTQSLEKKKLVCYNCQKEGHKSYNCNQPKKQKLRSKSSSSQE